MTRSAVTAKIYRHGERHRPPGRGAVAHRCTASNERARTSDFSKQTWLPLAAIQLRCYDDVSLRALARWWCAPTSPDDCATRGRRPRPGCRYQLPDRRSDRGLAGAGLQLSEQRRQRPGATDIAAVVVDECRVPRAGDGVRDHGRGPGRNLTSETRRLGLHGVRVPVRSRLGSRRPGPERCRRNGPATPCRRCKRRDRRRQSRAGHGGPHRTPRFIHSSSHPGLRTRRAGPDGRGRSGRHRFAAGSVRTNRDLLDHRVATRGGRPPAAQ